LLKGGKGGFSWLMGDEPVMSNLLLKALSAALRENLHPKFKKENSI
jgi:hypothetical protein